MSNIILASQSPRRKQLLEWAELDFDIVVEPTDESFPSNMAAEEVPIFIAAKKSDAVQHKLPGKIIIAADTIVVLGKEIINKPSNRDEAIDMLQKLSGQQHRVITGVVINGKGKSIRFSDITYVNFHPLTSEQIEFYVDQYKPYDKAGAYAIQEWIGVIGIKSINGDFYNVMGLPVSRVMKALEEFSHS
jgi:septum formation protein